jgi:hypothetical protein
MEMWARSHGATEAEIEAAHRCLKGTPAQTAQTDRSESGGGDVWTTSSETSRDDRSAGLKTITRNGIVVLAFQQIAHVTSS